MRNFLGRKPKNNVLRLIPLGGLGEIGKNMMVIECGEDIIVIDCGVRFPDEEMLGIDLVIPDITYLEEHKDKIRAIMLTHGHEDHVGALPYVLEEIENPPIYGTALTLGLAKSRLQRSGQNGPFNMHTVRPRDVVRAGCFEVEFIRVTHSIEDGTALAIRTPVGTVIHTGDFKIDQTPVDGELMDLHRFTQYGEEGVLLLLSDSTNVEREGYTLSEREVGVAFDEEIHAATGKVLVATFASHIHRIQQAIDVSIRYGRRVALIGRSMVCNARIAHELDYLHIPPDELVAEEDISTYPSEKLTVVCTGSQGEPMSALSRIALGEHKHVRVDPGDTVLLSAKVIPGNEKAITRMINHLFRRGAEVVYERVSEIHVSGHASQEELKSMINMVRPRFFVPIHGEYRHLVHHSRLARQLGIPDQNIFVIENGEVLELEGGEKPSAAPQGRVVERVPTGNVMLDGKETEEESGMVVRDRQHLSSGGMVVVVIGLDSQTGAVVSGPEIISRGFIQMDESQELLEEAKTRILQVMAESGPESKADWSIAKGMIRKSLQRFFTRRLRRRPMILPIVMEV